MPPLFDSVRISPPRFDSGAPPSGVVVGYVASVQLDLMCRFRGHTMKPSPCGVLDAAVNLEAGDPGCTAIM